MDQPVPDVSEQDVIRVVQRDFGPRVRVIGDATLFPFHCRIYQSASTIRSFELSLSCFGFLATLWIPATSEADSPLFGRLGWRHQLSNSIENSIELPIVALFEFRKLPSELLI